MTGRQYAGVRRTALLYWLIFTGLSLFGFFLLWRFGLIRQMLVADRTHISSFIVLVYLATTLHCLWRLIVVSREADCAWDMAQLIKGCHSLSIVGDILQIEGTRKLPGGLIASHIHDLAVKARLQDRRPLDQTLLLRGLASRLRGSNQLGAFASDTLMKLGLVGTIVGFIMMLAPIATLDMGNHAAVQSSLGLMSGGMAVAMYTTLAGLVGSILVKIQYLLLEAATTNLFAFIVGFLEVHLVLAAPPGQPG